MISHVCLIKIHDFSRNDARTGLGVAHRELLARELEVVHRGDRLLRVRALLVLDECVALALVRVPHALRRADSSEHVRS